jgi:hypothetical protein
VADTEVRFVLRVFIASPSDLVPEREAAHEVVEWVNRAIGRHSRVSIDLLGWEDTLPGIGRPQALINKDVEVCDVFLGLLWRRWGSATGEYSSGFEEEFELAKARNQASGSPDIWLYFKEISSDSLDDPGEQLRRVLQFRRKVASERLALFSQFSSEQDWTELLRDHLTQYVLGRGEPAPLGAEREASTSAQIRPETPVGDEHPAPETPPESDSADEQIVALESLGSYLKLRGKGDSAAIAPDERTVARAYLASFSLWALSRNIGLLESHAANVAYKFRESIQLSEVELFFVFRSILGNCTLFGVNRDTVPGWYWFQDVDDFWIVATITDIASNDLDRFVRLGALRFFHGSGLRPSPEILEPILRRAIRDGPKANRTAALALLPHMPPDVAVQLVELAGKASDSDENEILEAAVLARLAVSASDAFAFLLEDGGHLSRTVIAEIIKSADTISPGQLNDGLESPHPHVRLIALRVLGARREIDRNRVEGFLRDRSWDVRDEALDQVLANSWEIDVPKFLEALISESDLFPLRMGRDFRYRFVQSLPDDQVEQLLTWDSALGSQAYRVLAERQNSAFGPERIISDLENGFAELKSNAVDRYQELYGEKETAEIERIWGEDNALGASLRESYIDAAFQVVRSRPDKKYLDVARAELSSNSEIVLAGAVEILARFGDKSDVPALVQLAEGQTGANKEKFAAAACTLDPGLEGAVSLFMKEGNPRLVKVALGELASEDLDRARDSVVALFKSESDGTRQQAVAFLSERLSREELSALMDAHAGEGGYYYSVICWIDRALHLPALLEGAYDIHEIA